VVEIENQSVCQPFLGGWRRKNNGTCYYHAQTQTDYTVGSDDRLRIITPGKKKIKSFYFFKWGEARLCLIHRFPKSQMAQVNSSRRS
jgi:hypothetical protein